MSRYTDPVELHCGYWFTCPECGVDTLVYGAELEDELTADHMEDLRDECGIEPWEEGQWMTMPEQVTCRECNRVFETVDPRVDPDGGIGDT